MICASLQYITRNSATAKSTARPSCLVGVLYDIRETTDQQLINHFYVIGHEISYRIQRNNAK